MDARTAIREYFLNSVASDNSLTLVKLYHVFGDIDRGEIRKAVFELVEYDVLAIYRPGHGGTRRFNLTSEYRIEMGKQ